MDKPVNYMEKAGEACIRFASVLDEIQSFKAKVADALNECDEPFENVVGSVGDRPITAPQAHLGRYFDNGGRLPTDYFLGGEPDEDYGSDIFDCPACMKAYALCIERKKLRQVRGAALRQVRYYGRKAKEIGRG